MQRSYHEIISIYGSFKAQARLQTRLEALQQKLRRSWSEVGHHSRSLNKTTVTGIQTVLHKIH